MYRIEHYLTADGQKDHYTDWLRRLRDMQVKVAVIRRVARIEQGNFGDHKFCREGVWELRIDVGPGYRVYYGQAGQRLVLLHDPKAVWVEVLLKETKLDGLKPGQSVSVSVDAYPDRPFHGRIERIGTAATSQFALMPSPNPSGNFTKINQRVPVRIKVEQPDDNPLRPGMMVEVDIDRSSL